MYVHDCILFVEYNAEQNMRSLCPHSCNPETYECAEWKLSGAQNARASRSYPVFFISIMYDFRLYHHNYRL